MSKSFLKNVSLLVIFSLISGIMGFFREILLANRFGATFITDSFIIAMTIPVIIQDIFGNIITTVFIPLLNEDRTNEEKNKFFINIKNITLLLSILIVFLVIIFARETVNIIIPNSDLKTKELTITLTKISIVNIIFINVFSIFRAYYFSIEKYLLPSISTLLFNIPSIIYLIIIKNPNIYVLGMTVLLGYILQCVIMIKDLFYIEKMHLFYFNIKDKDLLKVVKLSIPLLFSVCTNQISNLIDKIMSSSFNSGSISIISFAMKIYNLIFMLIINSLIAVIFTQTSKLFANEYKKDETKIKESINKNFNILAFVVIPICVFIAANSKEIIILLFKGGKFGEESIVKTNIIFKIFIISLYFVTIKEYINRIFYSMKNTIIPSIIGIVGLIINIVLNIILAKKIGIEGIALATTLSSIIAFSITIVYFTRHNSFIDKKVFKTSIKSLINCILSFLVVLLVKKSIGVHLVTKIEYILYLILNGIMFSISYIILSVMTKTCPLIGLSNYLKKKRGNLWTRKESKKLK